MKISELIQNLVYLQGKHGDLDVWCYGMDKYGYANNEDEFEVMIRTKGELYPLDEDKSNQVCFIGA